MIFEPTAPSTLPAAIGPYSPALSIGDFVFISGQLGMKAETGELCEGVEAQTRQAMENMKAILQARGLDTRHVVKTTVFLADMNDFNTFNAVYGTYFSAPYPARSAIQVAALPKGARVEIEAFAVDTRALEVICNSPQCACNGGCSCHEEE